MVTRLTKNGDGEKTMLAIHPLPEASSGRKERRGYCKGWRILPVAAEQWPNASGKKSVKESNHDGRPTKKKKKFQEPYRAVSLSYRRDNIRRRKGGSQGIELGGRSLGRRWNGGGGKKAFAIQGAPNRGLQKRLIGGR